MGNIKDNIINYDENGNFDESKVRLSPLIEDVTKPTKNSKVASKDLPKLKDLSKKDDVALPERIIDPKMLKALEDQGITPEYIAKKIKTLLNARKDVLHGGRIVATVDDLEMINKGIIHALRLGVGGGYKIDTVNNQTQINVNMINTPEVKRQIEDFEAQLKSIL